MDYILGALTTALAFGLVYALKSNVVDRISSLENQVNDVNEFIADLAAGGDE